MGLCTKEIMNGVRCEYSIKVNTNDVVWIIYQNKWWMSFLFKTNPIGTKWCILYHLTYQYNKSLDAFNSKYSELNLSDKNMLGWYHNNVASMLFE